jgi:antitoxin component YwqK of YwqJK toxin-antitoxin module
MEPKTVSETTDKSAIVYQVDDNGNKNGYYRESIWNSSPKFVLIYDGQMGMQKILRPPDVVVEYYYKNGVLHGAYTITKQYNDFVTDYVHGNIKPGDAPLTRSRIEGEYIDGKKSGFEREFAYEHGLDSKLVREFHYRDGKLDGYARKFRINDGGLAYSAHFVSGLKHGEETYYDYDGGIKRAFMWSYGRAVVV